LARHFAHVDAIDVTARLIQHGFLLQEQGESRYVVKAEGKIVSFKNINISKHPFSAVKQKIIFSQGDACNLKPQYTGYDLIFCTNLLERLNDPESFLRHIDNRLNAQGYLVLASNYQWSDPDKMNSKILGGVKVNGENFTTLDGLKQLLCERFDFVNSSEIPYLLHQSNRQHQLNYSELSVWRLKQSEYVHL
jgi:putative 4-mercaptohistidine N1-methyltranferase